MQTSSIDVSVVIPARNEERFIEAALASVASQTWSLSRLEAVVVDNGSTDATTERVRHFQSTHADLAVQLLAESMPGVSRAKNRGAQAARGEWIIFLDADSRMAPDLVEQVMAQARRGFQAGSIRIVADSQDRLDRAFFGLMEFGKGLFTLHAQMFYCARAVFSRLGGFDEDLHVAEDRELLLRVQRAPLPLSQVRQSWIATSPRRLHRLPLRFNMVIMFVRWSLANWGIGRRWRY